MIAPPAANLTIHDAAAWLNTSERQVRTLIGRGLPVDDDGRVDAEAAAGWLEVQGLATRRKPWVVETLAEVAEFFLVAPTTVRTDWRAAGMPGAKGTYDLRAIWKWKSARARDPAKGAATKRAQLAAAKVAEERHRRLKLQNDLLAGKLAPIDEISQRWTMGLLRIRHRLEGWPQELSMGFPAATREQNLAELEEKVVHLLVEMSRWRPEEDPT